MICSQVIFIIFFFKYRLLALFIHNGNSKCFTFTKECVCVSASTKQSESMNALVACRIDLANRMREERKGSQTKGLFAVPEEIRDDDWRDHEVMWAQDMKKKMYGQGAHEWTSYLHPVITNPTSPLQSPDRNKERWSDCSRWVRRVAL